MDFYLEHICQPLFPYFSVKKLIYFTSCNKYLYDNSESSLENKCNGLYNVYPEDVKISWRYTLSLLKYGKRDIPVILNLCGWNVKLKCPFNTQICANYTNDFIWKLKTLDDVKCASKQQSGYSFCTSQVQICKSNLKLEDSLDDYLDNYENDCKHDLTYTIFREELELEFPCSISTPRKNCKRLKEYYPEFNGSEYIGLSLRNDGKTLFESIVSIDIFMRSDY
jgi:hypothetical protein